MKSLSAALDAHYAQEALTICRLWKVTLLDGRVFGFSDLDEDLAYLGTVFTGLGGFSASAIAQDTSLAVGSQEVDGQLLDTDLTLADIEAGTWDGAKVELWRVNYEDLSAGHEILAVSEIGQMRPQDGRLNVELRGFLWRLQNQQGRVFLPTCDAVLGDARCGVALAAYTFGATVTAVADRANFTASSLAQAADYFRYGLVTWTGGANSGRRTEVKSFAAGGAIGLQMPMVSPTAIGDTFTISAGCDKVFATCKAKFSNAVNFQGFHLIPGLPKIIAQIP